MKRLFGKKKKAATTAPESPSSSNRPFQPVTSSSQTKSQQSLSVKPAYLNLQEFTLPPQAYSVFATARDEEIHLDRCRRCSNVFVHTFMEWTTKIIAGIPPPHHEYTAISYVWGDYILLPLKCTNCKTKFRIPMHSAYRFRRLMMMTANSGDTVWLDALSIDQEDDEEKAKVLAVMGDIYSRAKTVAVLFPEGDRDGFHLVYDLTQAATAINNNKLEFSQSGQDGHPDTRLQELSKVCADFYGMLDQLDLTLYRYTYWRRAWTFQEWALARNLSITWEGGMPLNLVPVKTTILHAATLTAVYAFSQGAYATIKMGFPQAAVPGKFETLRRLFPDEEAFNPPGMVDEKQLVFDMLMSSMSFGSALGLRAAKGRDLSRLADPEPVHELYDLRPGLPLSAEERFRHRLCMALHSFGMSKREARYEADLVNCWASMCNIRCRYNVHDSYAVALQEMLHSLRTNHGVQVFNFHVTTSGASGEVDTLFQEYARPHDQCNARGKFNDVPIFSGRADTAVHLRLAIEKPLVLPRLTGSGVQLRKIKGAAIEFVVPLTNKEEVLYHMSTAVSGTADQFVFGNVLSNISDVLEVASLDSLQRSSLVIVSIPLLSDSPDANAKYQELGGLVVWAVVPTIGLNGSFVARESLNGTLVLAGPGPDNAGDGRGNGQWAVLAYLTLTDHQSGTLLLPVDVHGLDCPCPADHGVGYMNLTLKSPVRRGVVNGALLDDRIIRGVVRFEPASCTAY
ncbi:hypothetical protein HRR83_003747 [Exophiala dermatitidis]|uniref:Heterokaryon incompatibility domain-containing protein n=2 Tax=Exophiala dermatitidis TaxID=5970 RepID=H6BP86_EXODN|nr:uncharacterized protein HMPREF1120_01730 [Exophiala dermatitidis NIH/UT8656]KAJ4518951.1 hypothetical protein HRR75_002627 [Exophiala dermatitidis]EHY53541.1 hypothetical protein HMPREF1120_01730 [Exophiala dermatitidis NIH/UT8656]KAJ4522288.1 hypothetical protein HRR74_002871 [Exophiala dermatitidis]KAJ4529613.1 hypothetical protein HRR73_000639 [Exophiala dermatitidis]KAJ4543223.1 hypothetical protein HRR77_005480 [Exophiala dermatitidis]